MVDIGQAIFEAFSPLGARGMIACIFFIFYVDAIVFPTLPELFAVVIFMAIPEPWFAMSLLITIAFAEVLGLTTLYVVVRKVKVPQMIERALCRYRDFLMVSDERIILVNRIAPIVPFIGAFVAIFKWSYIRCIIYTLIGGLAKYGVILTLSGFFFVYFASGTAQTVTIVMIVVVIGVSLALSLYRRAKLRKLNANRTC